MHNAECIFKRILFIASNWIKVVSQSGLLISEFFPVKNSQSHILACGRQYVNVDRREKVCRNLQNLKIYTEEGTIKIFKKFENDKDGMSFEFTEQALDYIDISQYIMRLFEKDRVWHYGKGKKTNDYFIVL